MTIVRRNGNHHPSAVLREVEDWGLRAFDVVNPPSRLWEGETNTPPAVETNIDAREFQVLPSPAAMLSLLPERDNWPAHTRRSLARLHAYFLLCEDPQRRLDARPVNTLAHQVSLTRHVLGTPNLHRVLVADEVGLGKTVEAGMILQELLAPNPGLRVLYLAPARLVGNVRTEFDRLRLPFRQWSSEDGDARLDDRCIIASIHRAVHPRHREAILKTPAWDVIVVDECHHLTDWAEGGGDATLRYGLVKDLITRQRAGSRVILLSGTPHQGHAARFENLLSLLRHENEPAEALRGRVIYRTKEDVKDWDGMPLFPGRQVNGPLVVDLGPIHREWMANIHAYFTFAPPGERSDAKKRSASWRRAQALQWAASSPQAGLGYLVRQAVRAGWGLSVLPLCEALAALRPYRDGPIDEPLDQLHARLVKEVERQRKDADVEDIEEDLGTEQLADPRLAELLREGLAVILNAADAKWETLRQRVLEPAGGEKIVLFAQPIETVMALAGYLHRVMGERPALVLGGQTDAQRRKQVDSFRRASGPRFLVSSRAGGEGINLQVARRLVHLDVPWNPMEMEQRVGRVHRFGSRQTILVDTLVVKDSREADAYRIAREKLHMIAGALVEPERFEAVFSRVMCLVPPDELSNVMDNAPSSPLGTADQEKMATLVQEGFHAWRSFHNRYAEQERRIRQLDPGQARWDDLAEFLKTHLRAAEKEGCTVDRFVWQEGQIEPREEAARVLELGKTGVYACGDYAGSVVRSSEGTEIKPLGLNVMAVVAGLRVAALPTSHAGAAHLRWPRELAWPAGLQLPMGVLAFLRQSVRSQGAGWTEHDLQLRIAVVTTDGTVLWLVGAEKGALVRGLFSSTVRAQPETDSSLFAHLARTEQELNLHLCRPSEEDNRLRVRHAVTPLLAAIIATPA